MDKTGSPTIYICIIMVHNFKVIDSKWKKQNITSMTANKFKVY